MAVFTIFDSTTAAREATVTGALLDSADPLGGLLGGGAQTHDVLSNLSGIEDNSSGPLVGAIAPVNSARMLSVISPTGGTRTPTPNMQLLRVTGTTGTAGLYDAEVVTVNPDDNAVTVIRTGVQVRAITGTFVTNDIVQASRVAYTTNPHAGFAAKQVGIGNIVSVNGDTTAAQVLSVGTTGTDFAIDDSTPGTHKFNLPSASATARGAVTAGIQNIGGTKYFTSGSSGAGFISDYGHITNNAFELSNLQTAEDPTVTVSGGAVSGQVMQLNGLVYSNHYPGGITSYDMHYWAGFEASHHEENFPAYNAGTTYSRGNMPVRYSGVTYMYINGTPSSGNTPPNGTYWAVVPENMTCRFYLDNNVSRYGVSSPDFHWGFVLENAWSASSGDGGGGSYDTSNFPMIVLRQVTSAGTYVEETGRNGTDPFGSVYISGILTTLGTGSLAVSKGGTGRTTLDSGQLIAGAGTSAVDSLSSTRVVGETIELKLGSDSWIAFSEGSF